MFISFSLRLVQMMVFLVALLPAVLMSECQDLNDCSDMYNSGEKVSGIYSIYPAGDVPVLVYCEMISDWNDEDNGGWTVIQRRMDGSVNFYRPWDQYKRGFGNVEGEYWLGLENMYQLTSNRKYMLRVDLEDFDGSKGFALYSSFSVGPEADGYKLHVSGFKNGGAGDSLAYHNDQKFTTLDKDQDFNDKNCARVYLGAFWYNACHHANPNGVYLWGEDPTFFGIGNVWYSWKNNFAVGMKSITMKIRRVS
ncbi:microfibril-associated glycoprotein 4-like [Carassius auratus]|uniref:Microfibril-associated glycoprotein 4-like n=1 Tax=Carassius auratus TaxID=7957 RepID=A0A6P6N3N4_CARAU|nr:microfibril-associated glycoprotein 4-like [Carassius auratus]